MTRVKLLIKWKIFPRGISPRGSRKLGDNSIKGMAFMNPIEEEWIHSTSWG